jgi:hypothetical protein
MERQQLRDWLSKRLRLPDQGFLLVWKELDEDRYLSDYEQGESSEWEVLERAERVVQRHREWQSQHGEWGNSSPGRPCTTASPGEDRATQEFAVQLGGDERERANSEERIRAFSEAEARRADRHPDVRSYRREVLNGRLLPEEEAERIVRRARFSAGGELLPGAVDERLRTLVTGLARLYRWRQRDAVLYVLSGRTPRVNPFEARISYGFAGEGSRRALITLTLEPWVSADNVRRTYKATQDQVLGRDNRRVSDHNLRLLRFVEERTGPDGKRLAPWRDLMDAWNEEHPGNAFRDVNRFRKIYTRTRRYIAYPKHH